MYTKLKTWISPTSLSDLTLSEIVAKLKDHMSAETVEIAKHYRFYKSWKKQSSTTCQNCASLPSLVTLQTT